MFSTHRFYKPRPWDGARLLSAVGAAALAAMTLAACGGSSTPPRLELALSNLENLGPTAVYEGWLIVNGAPQSTGRFTVDDQGHLSNTSFELTQAQADGASQFVLTIEPAQGDVPAASETHLLAGPFDSARQQAALSVGASAALGTDFSGAAGHFFLATPTTASLDDEAQGLWWAQVADGTPQAGLELPALPAGWVYEGWLVIDGKPVSTGRFNVPDGADTDAAGPTAGTLGAPPFPGQDFITPPVALPGTTAVISVEPEPDNSAAPFTLKPLAGQVGALVGPENSQTVANTVGNGSSLPRGTARILR